MKPHPRLLRGLLAALVAALVLVWAAHDLPRRWLERTLAERLDARVEIGAVSLASLGRVILRDLEVTGAANLPALERLHVGRLVAEGRWRAMLAGRFERLTFEGAEARLVPAGAPPSLDAPAAFQVDEVVLTPARLLLAGDPDQVLTVAARLHDVGREMNGEIALRGPHLDAGRAARVFGRSWPAGARLERLAATLVFSGDGWALTADAGAAEATGPDWRTATGTAHLEVRPRGEGLTVDARLAAVTATAGGYSVGPLEELRLDASLAGTVWRLGAQADAFDQLHLVVDGERLDARLDGARTRALAPDLGVDAEVDLTARGVRERLEYDVRVGLRSWARSDGTAVVVDGGTLTARGEATLADFPPAGTTRANLTVLGLRFGDRVVPAALFPLRADAAGRVDGGRFEGTARVAAADLRLAARGRASADAVRLSWRLEPLPFDRLAALAGAAGWPAPPASASEVEANGTLTGSPAAPVVAAAMAIRDLVPRVESWPLAPADVRAEARWRHGAAEILLPSLTIASSWNDVPVSAEARARATLDLTAGTVDGALVRLSGLGEARVEGRWWQDDGLAAAARIEARSLPAAEWLRRLGVDAGDALLDGTAEADLDASWRAGDWRLAGEARLADAGFSSADGTRVVVGLDGRWDVRITPLEIAASGETGGAQVLWETIYADLSTTEAPVSFAARASDDGWHLEAGAELPGGPRLRATLDPERSGGRRFAATLAIADLGAFHDRYTRDVFADRFGRVELAGSLDARASGAIGGGALAELDAGVTLAGVRLASEPVTLARLDLELPVRLRRRPDGGFGGPPAAGRLRVAGLELRGQPVSLVDSPLASEGDAVRLEETVEVALLGGELAFERLGLRRLLGGEAELLAGLRWSGVDLERVSEVLGILPLEGTLDGQVPSVRLRGGVLEVDGSGEISLFGGTARIYDVSGREVLSRYPSLTFSADVTGIDLERLTRRFGFGVMTGVLEGSLNDCQIFRTVPTSCTARFHTVRREGVPQRIAVRAVENIAELGSGARTGAFRSGFLRFFDSYRYAAFGFSAHLHNDVLLLHGLERRGDRELFLRGRLPLRLDVVNARPGAAVSFQDLVARLRNLDLVTVTTGRGPAAPPR